MGGNGGREGGREGVLGPLCLPGFLSLARIHGPPQSLDFVDQGVNGDVLFLRVDLFCLSPWLSCRGLQRWRRSGRRRRRRGGEVRKTRAGVVVVVGVVAVDCG